MRRPRTFTEEDSPPLSLPWVYILLTLADEARHGYGIMRDVEERTAGKVNLWPATLYGAIRRMVRAGLVEEAPPPDDGEDRDARRRYYRLTSRGRDVLQEEATRLADLVAMAQEKKVIGTRGAR